jgi:phage replication-related protein YjqB (UPF0714/DUF867 family)
VRAVAVAVLGPFKRSARIGFGVPPEVAAVVVLAAVVDGTVDPSAVVAVDAGVVIVAEVTVVVVTRRSCDSWPPPPEQPTTVAKPPSATTPSSRGCTSRACHGRCPDSVRDVFSELLATPGVEEHVELRSRVGFLALHGGLEEGTAEIATAAAARGGATVYGVIQPADLAWHVPSHLFDPDDSPHLRTVLDRCDVVVSVHGYGRHGFWTTVLVGGAARPLATRLAAAVRPALPEYRVLDEINEIPPELRGLDPRNPVNRSRTGGVQLELPPRVRGIGPQWAHLPGDGFTPHTEALVDALARFAISDRH